MAVSDETLLREYDERREHAGWPHEACIDAVAENHGMNPDNAAAIANRLRHLLADRIAPMRG